MQDAVWTLIVTSFHLEFQKLFHAFFILVLMYYPSRTAYNSEQKTSDARLKISSFNKKSIYLQIIK